MTEIYLTISLSTYNGDDTPQRLPYVNRQLFYAFQSTPHESQLKHETTHKDNAFKSVGHSCGTLRTAVTCANQMG